MTKKFKGTQKTSQKKSLETQLDKMYNQIKCGQFKIFLPKLDVEQVLEKQQGNLQQQEQIDQFEGFVKYKNASMEEVDKLWRYDDEIEQQIETNDNQEVHVKTYNDMLNDIYQKLELNQQQHQQKQIQQAKLQKVGKTKFLVTNYKEICEELNRRPQEINEMLGKYLNTNPIIQEDGQLLIKASVTQGQVAEAIERYANTYVKCDGCGSYNTMVIRSEDGRNLTLSCEDCKCTRHIR